MPPPTISLVPVAFLVLVGLTAGVWGQDCVYGSYRKGSCNCDAGYWGLNCWQSEFCGVQTYMAPETGVEAVRIVPNTATNGGRCTWYLRGYNPNDLVSFQTTCSWCSSMYGTVTFYDGYGLEGDVLYTGPAYSASVMSTDNWMTVVFDITSSSGSFNYRIESHPVEDASTPSHDYILPDGPYCDCSDQCDGGDCICTSSNVAPPGCADTCSGTQYNYYYEAQYHNVFSNNHGNYAPSSSCQWSYAFDKVTFSIEYFKTEPTYDTLRIYTGIEPKLWGTFDGTWAPVTFTLCGPVFVEFSSDDSFEESGFYINVAMDLAWCTQNDPFPENTFVSSSPSTSEDSANFCIECFVIPIVVVSGVLCVSFIVFLRIRRSRSGTFGAVVGTQPNSTVSTRASGNNNAKSNLSSRTTVVTTTKRDPDRSTESHDEKEDGASARSKSKPVPVYTGGALRGSVNVFGRKSGPTNVTASEGESADTREDTAGSNGDAYSSGYYSESPESSSSSSEKRRRRRRRSSSSKGSKKGPTKRGSSGRRHHHRRRRHGGRFDESSADNTSEDQSSTHDDEPEPKAVSEPIKNNPFLGRLSLR